MGRVPRKLRKKIRKRRYVNIFRLLEGRRRVKKGKKKDKKKHSRPKGVKVAKNIVNWVRGFLRLASVVGHYDASQYGALLSYADSILGAFRDYEGWAWLNYDEKFRDKMAGNKGMSWAVQDINLWLTQMTYKGISGSKAMSTGSTERKSVRGRQECVWVVGHSFIHWAANRAQRRPYGLNLELEERNWKIVWIGQRGMKWDNLLSLVEQRALDLELPKIVLIHLGGNDVGTGSCKDLIVKIKKDFGTLMNAMPDTHWGWSDIIVRFKFLQSKLWCRGVKKLNTQVLVICAYLDLVLCPQKMVPFLKCRLYWHLLEVILKKIAATIISFMQVERCTIFIVDEDCPNSFSSVLHMACEEVEKPAEAAKSRDCDVNKLNYMYAQYVTNTMETLNIPDVCKDTRFPWTNENAETQCQQVQSLLCAPITNGKKSKVIGVCQLVNKIEEKTSKIKAFNRNDEQFLEAFAIFCGLGIQNTQMYEVVERAMAKQMVTLEVLSYHASATEEDTRELQVTATAIVPSAQSLRLMDFSFSDFELSDLDTTLATIRMFTDLGLLQSFQIKYEVLCRWILSVKKNYRKNVAYHNWRHAFSTAQCMFAALKTGKMQSKLRDLEILALLIEALSHDLDHRGVNNSYIQRSDHPLAQLYGHSIMENHHFDQCLMILTSPGNQILSGLSLEEYRSVLRVIKQAILSTDLALYMRRRGEFFDLVGSNLFSWENAQHKELFVAMLMTACDLSAVTKPWPVQQHIIPAIKCRFGHLHPNRFQKLRYGILLHIRQQNTCPDEYEGDLWQWT
ncbi:cGMP-specific 3',5'-cyclic phosphodiesterase-like [Rhinatrema bivittatum]|uniref:cGMP-specific 3',5'-cyclic phosphodiesterase-like n=1 Tax=Rhinatrema bivittatum TaxID=194408 RepID=UPI00112DBACD|nr:cGMP-specific 3',5'-cyclic phosphodiesterase-like [Rhinatrema bivittatum]